MFSSKRHALISTFILISIWYGIEKHVQSNTVKEINLVRGPSRYTTVLCDKGACSNVSGKYFNITTDDSKMCTDIKNYITLNSSSVSEFVIVTGASEDHVQAFFFSAFTVRKHLGERRIVFYDLGLTSESSVKQVKAISNLEYRTMNFSRYPDHVKSLSNYRWKPLVINEVLRDYSALFWIDTSVRISPDAENLSAVFKYIVDKTAGVVLFKRNRASTNYEETHPAMYDYIPTNLEKQKKLRQYGAASMIFYRTKWVMENIMCQFVMCALDANCMAPAGSQKFCNGILKKWEHCHKYEQSFLNLLLSNALNYDDTKYAYPGKLFGLNWKNTL